MNTDHNPKMGTPSEVERPQAINRAVGIHDRPKNRRPQPVKVDRPATSIPVKPATPPKPTV